LPYAKDLVLPNDQSLQFDEPVGEPLEELPVGPPAGQAEMPGRPSAAPHMLADDSVISQGTTDGRPLDQGTALTELGEQEPQPAPIQLESSLSDGLQAKPPRLQLGSPRLLDSETQRDVVRIAQRDPLDRVIGSGADPKLSLTSPRPLAELTAPQNEPPPVAPGPQGTPDESPLADAAPGLADQLPPPPPWIQGPANAESPEDGTQTGSGEPSESAPTPSAWRARDK
jgi:hypothetical protein